MGLLDSIGDVLVGGKKPLPKLNSGELNGIVDASKNVQNNMIGDTYPKLGEVTDKYASNITGAVDDAQKARQDTNNAFLNSIRDKRNQLNNDQFNTGKTQILQSVKPAQDSIREVLSGSGVGLQGGAAVKQLSQPILDANSKVNDLANSLSEGAQEADINTMGQINTQDNSFILQKLGIDQDTFNAIMSSDRQDLKDQLQQMLAVEGQSTADKLGITQNAFNADLAGTSAENQSRNALLASLLGAGATAGGLAMGRK